MSRRWKVFQTTRRKISLGVGDGGIYNKNDKRLKFILVYPTKARKEEEKLYYTNSK